MRKLTIAILIASSCLLAEDAPKQISQDFVKPGLKALIAVRNASTTNMGIFPVTVQSVIDDAELEAATDADKITLALVRRLKFLRTLNAIDFYTLSIKHTTELRGNHDANADIHGPLEAAKDPVAIKSAETVKACGDEIENILRSRTLALVPHCDLPKEEPKPVQVQKEEPKVEPKPVEAVQSAPKPAPATYCFIKAKTPRNVQNMSRKIGIYECPPGVGQ